MEVVNCNLCGSDQFSLIYRKPDLGLFRSRACGCEPYEWFDVVECNNCGLGFVNPRPTRSEISRYYPREFFQYFHDQSSFHQKRYAAEAMFLTGIVHGSQPARLLDIGCASGAFPRFMRARGWYVEGVEVADAADPITDFPVHRGEFPGVSLDAPSYDAITAWAVLEHVHDPGAHFRKVGRLLRPGGHFVFLVTNFDSISSRYLFLEDVPRHLYFFTQKTVSLYLELAGLKLERAVYGKSIYQMPPVNWMRYLVYRFIRRRRMDWTDIPPSRIDFLRRWELPSNLGTTFRYIWQYPGATIDRLLMPFYERFQILTRRYGIVTYVASQRN
jgi:SAM-dependent methyltransferase